MLAKSKNSAFKPGYALSQKFAQEGHHVIATTRNVDALEGLEGAFAILKSRVEPLLIIENY